MPTDQLHLEEASTNTSETSSIPWRLWWSWAMTRRTPGHRGVQQLSSGRVRLLCRPLWPDGGHFGGPHAGSQSPPSIPMAGRPWPC